MPRKQYVESLEALNSDFLTLLQETKTCFVNALQSLKNSKVLEDYNFKKKMKKFHEADVKIEKDIFTLIARQAPVSSDLRLTLGILKSTNDVKRIVSTSYRIAKIVKRYSDQEKGIFASKDDALLNTIEEMGSLLNTMLDQVIDVFTSQDKLNSESSKELQKTLIQEDDVVDTMFKGILKKLVKKIQKEVDSKKQAKQIADGLILIRHMERIGDHICNIAERLIYIDTGRNVPIY